VATGIHPSAGTARSVCAWPRHDSHVKPPARRAAPARPGSALQCHNGPAPGPIIVTLGPRVSEEARGPHEQRCQAALPAPWGAEFGGRMRTTQAPGIEERAEPRALGVTVYAAAIRRCRRPAVPVAPARAHSAGTRKHGSCFAGTCDPRAMPTAAVECDWPNRRSAPRGTTARSQRH
jgi:hypothetical protein